MSTPVRILFYSHDTFGLGHIRRTLAVCEALSKAVEDASMLVLTGSSAVHLLRIPDRVDYVKLPCVTKVGDEHYESKFLNLDFDAIRALREEIIFRTAVNYAPDMILIDNVPLGMKGELLKTLHYFREFHSGTRIILNFRDVIDEPRRVIPNWTSNLVYDAIDFFYDRVLVYGSPDVFDFVREYRLPAGVAGKVEYVGYIARATRPGAADLIRRRLVDQGEKLALITAGGGGDGYQVIEKYLEGLASADPIVRMHSHIVLGTDMPATHRETLLSRFGRKSRVSGNQRVSFADIYDDLTDYVEAADVVLSMGGYNTISEILSLGKRSVVVPRVAPRLEQWIRCSRMAELGLLRVVHPADATPGRLVNEVLHSLSDEPSHLHHNVIRLDGLHHVSTIVRAYCDAQAPFYAERSPDEGRASAPAQASRS